MKHTLEEKILNAVDQVVKQKLPAERVTIEYNFELPQVKGVKKDKFYGIKAKFNEMVAQGECKVTFTY